MSRRTREVEQPAPPRFRLDSRASLIGAAVVLLLGVIMYHAQDRWLAVVMLLLSDGVMVAGWIGAAWAWGKIILRLCHPERARNDGAFAFATSVAIGLGVIGLLSLGLGLLGALNRWTALAILLIGPALLAPRIVAHPRRANQIRIDAWLFEPAGWHWLWLLAVPFVGTMITGASILPGFLWKPDDPHPYDAMEYHLHVPREWHELGRIVPLKHNVFSFFPFGTEMHYLLAMHIRGGAWRAMYQCQFLSVAWAILTAVAVYGAARRSAKDAMLPCAAAIMVLATPWTVMLGSVAYQEGLLGLYACLTVAWALEALRSDGPVRPMLIAGVLAGLACGVKYTAVPMVLGAVGLASVVGMVVMRRVMIRPLLVYGVIGIAVSSPWLIRNAVWAKGNPVFPLAMRALGKGHFDEKQVERFEVAHSPTAAQKQLGARVLRVWKTIATDWQYAAVPLGKPQTARVWLPLLWIIISAAIVSGASAVANHTTDAGGRWGITLSAMIAAYLVIVLVIWIFFTHLLGRFFYLTVPVAALAVAAPQQKWWRWSALAGVVATCIVSAALLMPKFEYFAKHASKGLFGMDDLSFMAPAEIQEMDVSKETVALVGDAQAFLYPVPASRLRYRTVFDLPTDANDAWQAWLGVPLDKARGVIVVHPAEIERLSKTYRNVPGLPPELRDKGPEPFVIRK